MTLAVGSRLGPYEILAPLGAGGMEEVYRFPPYPPESQAEPVSFRYVPPNRPVPITVVMNWTADLLEATE